MEKLIFQVQKITVEVIPRTISDWFWSSEGLVRKIHGVIITPEIDRWLKEKNITGNSTTWNNKQTILFKLRWCGA